MKLAFSLKRIIHTNDLFERSRFIVSVCDWF